MSKEIGIDLGTTNTVVSYVDRKGRLRSLRYKNNKIIPSAVFFISKNEYIIGDEARKRFDIYPGAGVINFKPKIGEAEKLEITAENGETFKYRAKKVACDFLNTIINEIEKRLIKEFGPEEGCIGDVVITVPAKFNDAEKEATRKAALRAGFERVKLATEPTAAAVAHEEDSGEGGSTVLVYDFGGGTFDVSVIRNDRGKFVEVVTGGNKKLGGNVLTDRIAEYLFKIIEDDYGIIFPFEKDEFDEDLCEISRKDYMLNRNSVFEAANEVKEELSDSDSYETAVNLILPGEESVTWMFKLTRERMEKLIYNEIKTTADITEKLVQEAREKGVEKIDRFVLAGGSSQIPLVQKLLRDRFADESICVADDVSTLISRGAALLAGRELENVTESVTSVQYGVTVTDGDNYRIFKTIIPENVKLPYSAKDSFKLQRDGQTSVEIPYFERDIKNYPNAVRADEDGISEIDTIVISKLPEGLKTEDTSIEVEFTVQKDGTMDVHVEILDGSGNKIKNVEVVCEKRGNLE